ncbi:hypothetical protein IFU39_00295 [Paenibacillus sp. CFBP 13594]|uniref:hypothetical protein n=1 Tax=Paenibacillus sp. CFBP 13594 TaxID=2774037 RepID=UPI001783959E|nr:hypothetical protein [Paenibacillus sp. CFBP 13594]MBD8836258.1 hypothetical protein [Paenibacillus sp. CFBP 13594]
MDRNNRLQKSLDTLKKSLEALNMAIDRQHLATNNMEQSTKEYFQVKNHLEMKGLKGREWKSNSTKRSNT